MDEAPFISASTTFSNSKLGATGAPWPTCGNGCVRGAEATGPCRAGADDLLAHATDSELGTGLYEGAAGIAYVLEETFRTTGDKKYRDGFLAGLEAIAGKAQPQGRGVEWSAPTDIISGTAGTGLALLYAHGRTGSKRWLEIASAAGDRLLELGKPKNGGLDWAMDPGYPRLMPNFAHGTAGAAFFLARLFEATKPGSSSTLPWPGAGISPRSPRSHQYVRTMPPSKRRSPPIRYFA